MSDRPIPCLVGSGFLGSGKTTLVRRLLDVAQAEGARVAFVSNELGELGVDQAMLATGFPYNSEWMAENVATFAWMMPRVRAIRRPGAAALDMACLAAGRLDGFWEIHLQPWDVAAGMLLVTEAGGTVSGPDGLPYPLGAKTIVASNGKLHEPLLEALAAQERT